MKIYFLILATVLYGNMKHKNNWGVSLSLLGYVRENFKKILNRQLQNIKKEELKGM